MKCQERLVTILSDSDKRNIYKIIYSTMAYGNSIHLGIGRAVTEGIYRGTVYKEGTQEEVLKIYMYIK